MWVTSGCRTLKYHVSILAVFSVVSLLKVEANGASGANWYLHAPDGSRQGPYGHAQLGEWVVAGYVLPGRWLASW